MSIFDVNNPFWQFLNKMADLFLLSLLWMLCSLPVITFGASTTAFLAILMELNQNLEGSIFKDFFRKFRRFFKRATLVWLIQLPLLLFILLDLRICSVMKQAAGWFLLPIITVIGLMFLILCLFVWPLLANSAAALRQIWTMACYITAAYLPHGISMLFLVGIAAVAVSYFPSLCILVPGLVCYQYARIYVWIFGRDLRVRTILNGNWIQEN